MKLDVRAKSLDGAWQYSCLFGGLLVRTPWCASREDAKDSIIYLTRQKLLQAQAYEQEQVEV